MTRRAVFFEEDHARAVAIRLRNDGFEATVAREKFAGDDDDDDHPWAVTTDAPLIMLDLVAEEYDGWLDVEEQQATEIVLPPSRPTPMDLPAQPRRLHRPPE